jgi:signal transduction histidine kinase
VSRPQLGIALSAANGLGGLALFGVAVANFELSDLGLVAILLLGLTASWVIPIEGRDGGRVAWATWSPAFPGATAILLGWEAAVVIAAPAVVAGILLAGRRTSIRHVGDPYAWWRTTWTAGEFTMSAAANAVVTLALVGMAPGWLGQLVALVAGVTVQLALNTANFRLIVWAVERRSPGTASSLPAAAAGLGTMAAVAAGLVWLHAGAGVPGLLLGVLAFIAALRLLASRAEAMLQADRLDLLVRLAGELSEATTQSDMCSAAVDAAREVWPLEHVDLLPEGELPSGAIAARIDVGTIPMAMSVAREHGPHPLTTADEDYLAALGSLTRGSLAQAALLRNLQRENELKAHLMAAAAHDLRNPLGAVAGSIETIERGLGRVSEDVLRSVCQTGARASRRMRSMIESLLELERAEHQGMLEDASCCALESARSAASHVSLPSGVDVQVVGDEAEVAIDARVLERVIDNLLTNAVKHSPSPGTVSIRVETGSPVQVHVDDEGPGVPPTARAAIFAAFSQVPDDPTRAQGVGLGLYIAARFVALSGGSIATSTAPAGGARFTVSLPASAAARAATPRSEPAIRS